MLIPVIHRPARAVVIAALALGTGLAACGGEDNPTPVAAAASGSALLAQIPTLGEEYPAHLARFVDTEAGKDYGLAVTVAGDGDVVAYLCDGRTLGRAFSGTIEDGADSATLKAVKGDGTVDLTLSGDAPTSASVKSGDVSDDFALEPTKVGGYFRERVKGVTRGWVVSDTLELKGIQTSDEAGGKSKATTTGVSSPPLTAEEQGLVGVKESPSAPPESRSFIKEKRCSALNRQLNDNGDVLDAAGSAQEIKDAMTANNLIVAKAKALGCGFAQNLGFFVTT